MPGQSPDQGVGLLRRRGRSAEREADGQLRYPRRRGRTELSQADMLVIERDKDFSARARLKRDGADEPGEKAGRAGAPRGPVGAGLTHAGRTSRWRKIRIQRALRNRAITKSELDGNIVQPPGREAAIEVPHSGDDHPDNRRPDVGPGLVQHDEIETLLLDELDAGDHLRSVVEMAEIGPGGGWDRSIVARQEVGMLASRAGESHPQALPEPYVTLSRHTAPDVRPFPCRKRQCANRCGLARMTRASQSLAPLGR